MQTGVRLTLVNGNAAITKRNETKREKNKSSPCIRIIFPFCDRNKAKIMRGSEENVFEAFDVKQPLRICKAAKTKTNAALGREARLQTSGEGTCTRDCEFGGHNFSYRIRSKEGF